MIALDGEEDKLNAHDDPPRNRLLSGFMNAHDDEK
jgi:hypothetical protein